MATAERRRTPAERGEPGGQVPGPRRAGGSGEPERAPLWVDEPAARPRMPDPVRTAAVRAVLIVALTLIQAMVAFLATLAESWLAFPMVLSSVASTIAATWAVLDVWVTRQVWNQRHGVVSAPGSTARERRRERRAARRAAKAGVRIPDPSGGAPATAPDGARKPRTTGTAPGGDATPEATVKGSGSGARPAGRDRVGSAPATVKAPERERELTHSS
ncbi:hypothetical protein GA0115237_106910 [Streptomyces sp. ScaeMP-6W]|uniref:hypothetical protein n=1 Tax=unclassified Streptomyces TaxID=2593676 RepID=UPI00081D93E6|nr:hypothetical protein [Streptomyces sp. ScaeMP-6W]SCD94173.1 hypothetical protein GA0115237_106910 [Streptomyces sp. ScaeMP-6W]